ncbi:MAG TPA: transglutaminase domain-containing protein [Puia sp.]|nr:transglutaminase domain-containing protein [Puia sp.]
MRMTIPPAIACCVSLCFLFSPLNAQPWQPERIFGDVTPGTFAPTAYDTDSSASAVYLFDHGTVSFDPSYNNSHGFSIVYERHTRIRILNKNGLGLATIGISATHRGNYEVLIEDVRGATYNLEDGKVVITKLDKSNIFKDKNGYVDIDKIAFPNVREGSVIDYSYRIIYPSYAFIPEWEFQGNYPVLWSEYEVTVPVLFDYFVKSQGYRNFNIDTTLYSTDHFPVYFAGFSGSWDGQTIHRIWALQDVAPLEKKEPYTTTLRNHVQKVQFQLSAVRMNGYQKTYRTTWPELTTELLKNPNFGGSLDDRNHFMDDELKKFTTKGDTSLAAAMKIFSFVRDQFSFSGQEVIYQSQDMKKTWEEKKGNVADINLLLAAIFRKEGFDATPVILSTRAHGTPLYLFPLLGDYNYVVVRVRTGGVNYLLDATRPSDGFGQLPDLCYNGMARVIDAGGETLPLFADSAKESRITMVSLDNDDAGGYSGTYSRIEGVFESMTLRNRLRKEKPEDFFESLRKGMAEYKQMKDYGFDSLATPERPLGFHYSMTYHFTQQTIYFNPIMHDRISNSPLTSPERHYPVEIPYRVDNHYVLRMAIPKGYKIDQLPKSARFSLADSSALFEYLIDADENTINFRTRLQLNKTNYPVSEYPGLRDFFSLIVQKEKEPIVFKKIQ